MSLPTAQLGSLPSINLPNYVPGPSYKPVNPWVQAITAMLANAGTTAGEGLVNNELSSDNAKEFGKQDATGWDRLLHGPAVSDKEAMQLRGQSADRENLAMSGQLADSRQAALLEAEGERAKQTQRAETLRAREGNASRERDFSSNLDRELATSDRTQAGMDARAQREINAQAGARTAQEKEALALAKFHDAQTALQIKTNALIPDPKAPPTTTNLHPDIVNDATLGATSSTTQPFQSPLVDGIHRWLQGSTTPVQYAPDTPMTPEQLRQRQWLLEQLGTRTGISSGLDNGSSSPLGY